MSESVIFNSPILIVLYGIALAVTLFEKVNRTGAVSAWIAAMLVVGASTLSVIMGASLVETAAIIVLFIIINLIKKKGETS